MTIAAKVSNTILAFAACLVLAACSTTTSSNAPATQNTVSEDVVATGKKAHVYLYRGGFNGVFSQGVNQMAQELRNRGVPATSIRWSTSGFTLDQIRADHKNGQVGPIILAGHSLGAEAVKGMANELTKDGIPVDLVIVFDALTSSEVPKGVKRFVNYKAIGSKNNPGNFKPGRGFDGELVNVDVRTLPQLEQANHWNLVNQERLKELAVEEIVTAYRKYGAQG